jgi:TfoX/Sxy family transcriptional regulator of competence genes
MPGVSGVPGEPAGRWAGPLQKGEASDNYSIMRKRILYLLSLIFGLMGLLGCVAAIIGIWIAQARLVRSTQEVAIAVDDSLAVIERRVTQTQHRVQALKITAEDIEQSVKNWGRAQARERFNLRLGVEEKSERIVSGLQRADHWLDVAESSVQLVQKTLKVGGSVGAPVQTERVERVLKELASLRAQLTQASERVGRIRERAAEADEESLREEAFSQIRQLTLRVIATLSTIDARLERVGDRLSEIHAKTRKLRVDSVWWIRITAIGITLLIGWMAAGQGSLCFLGWRGLRLTSVATNQPEAGHETRP